MFAISKLKSKFAQNLKINRMKKLIIVSVIAAFFAACGNKNNESAAKVTTLKTWVDSVNGLAASSTSHDSATWATWNASYTEVLNGINEQELDEASKKTLEETKASWDATGKMYTEAMNTEKAQKEAEMKAAMDTMNKAPEAGMDGKEMKKEEEKK